MKIRFWSTTPLPMYGTTVEEIHLDIDGDRWVVKADAKGKPVLALVTPKGGA